MAPGNSSIRTAKSIMKVNLKMGDQKVLLQCSMKMGRFFKKGSFKNGVKDGSWSIFDDKGVLLDEVFFRNGRAT
jgi:antitoxin component YwqK of YwqJK toxin-antitoxin module